MPGLRCCIQGCKNGYKCLKNSGDSMEHRSISMYSFPKDPLLRNVWIKKCKLAKHRNPDCARVCVEHFSSDQFEVDMKAKIMGLKRAKKLKQGAFPDHVQNSALSNRRALLNEKRKIRLEKRSVKKDINKILDLNSLRKNKRNKISENSTLSNNIEDSCSPDRNSEFSISLISDNNSLEVPTCEESHKEEISQESLFKNDEITDNERFPVEHNRTMCIDSVQHRSVESEMEKMFSHVVSESGEKTKENGETCSNCETLRSENDRLKIKLAFFQSKLSLVVDTYQQAEKLTVNKLKRDLQKDLKTIKKVNAELTFNNSRYLNLLKSLLTNEEFENKVMNIDKRQNWTEDELSNSVKLKEISHDAYIFVKDVMNIHLPELEMDDKS